MRTLDVVVVVFFCARSGRRYRHAASAMGVLSCSSSGAMVAVDPPSTPFRVLTRTRRHPPAHRKAVLDQRTLAQRRLIGQHSRLLSLRDGRLFMPGLGLDAAAGADDPAVDESIGPPGRCSPSAEDN